MSELKGSRKGQLIQREMWLCKSVVLILYYFIYLFLLQIAKPTSTYLFKILFFWTYDVKGFYFQHVFFKHYY